MSPHANTMELRHPGQSLGRRGLCPVERADHKEGWKLVRRPEAEPASETAEWGDADIPVPRVQTEWLSKVRTCARHPWVSACARQARRELQLSAMPRCQGAQRPAVRLRKSREQVARAVWMKRGAGCPRHSSAFIYDARGRNAG